jgi:hypothetical protein
MASLMGAAIYFLYFMLDVSLSIAQLWNMATAANIFNSFISFV